MGTILKNGSFGLDESQRAHLRARRNWTLGGNVVMAFGTVFLASVHNDTYSPNVLERWGLVSLVVLGWVFVLRLFLRVRLDLRGDALEMIEGEVILEESRLVGHRHSIQIPCLLLIKGQRFEVSRCLFSTLGNRQQYRVYYTPHTREILRCEAI